MLGGLSDMPRAGANLSKQFSRLRFLSGIGAAAALAACGKNDNAGLAVVPQAATRDLAFYMRRTGCSLVEYHGIQYFSDGSSRNLSRQPADCGTVSPQLIGRSPKFCVNPTPAPATVNYNVGFSFANVGSSSIQFGLTEPAYGIEPSIGPLYNSDREAPDCSNPIEDAQEIAQKAAEYVAENPGAFPTAVVIAARAAIDDWEGTGMGVAASATFAMEFLALLGVALSPLDFLIILAAIGVSIAVAIELWKCFHH